MSIMRGCEQKEGIYLRYYIGLIYRVLSCRCVWWMKREFIISNSYFLMGALSFDFTWIFIRVVWYLERRNILLRPYEVVVRRVEDAFKNQLYRSFADW